jgi:hypothetical protein
MKKKKKILELKVYKNKKNGQALVVLPKKKLGKIPKKVKISWLN